MAADFKPTLDGYKDMKPFVFWAQTTLPTVFDDSLSYYEVLTKLTKMVNTLLENTDTAEHNIEALATVFGQLQDYVNHYFDSLDVSAEVDAKLDAMVADGTLDAIIQPIVEHYTEEVIDDVVHSQLSTVVAEQIGGAVAEQIDAAIAPQITPKVNAYLDTNLPPLVEEQVPVAVGEQIDPSVAVLLPSVVDEQLPNAVSTEMQTALPPVVQSQLPGVVAQQIPGAVASQMPPILSPIATQQIQTLVPNWLATHIHNPSSPPLDDTLGLKNCAAESWYVGRRFFDLQGSPATMEEDKKVVYQTGEVVEAEHWLTFTATVSDKFPVSVGYPHFDLTQDPIVDWTYAYYDANGDYISESGNTWEGFINWGTVTEPVPDGAATIKFSIQSDASDFVSGDLAVLVFGNGAQIINAINDIDVSIAIDDTLTQPDMAADAKVTGERIAQQGIKDNSNLTGASGLVFIDLEPGVISTPSVGSTTSFTPQPAGTTGRYCGYIPVSEGDTIYCRLSAGTESFVPFIFTDENYVVTRRSVTTARNIALTAGPADKYLAVNTLPDGYYAGVQRVSSPPVNKIDTLNDARKAEITAIEKLLQILNGAASASYEPGIIRTPTAGSQATLDRETSSQGRYSAYSAVKPGDRVFLKTSSGTSTVRPYAWLDSNLIVLSTSGTSAGEFKLTAPKNAAYIVSNSLPSASPYMVVLSNADSYTPSANVGMFNKIAVCGYSWDSGYAYAPNSSSPKTRRSRSWIACLANMYGIDYACYGVPSGVTAAPGSQYIGHEGAVCWQSDSHGLPALLNDPDPADLFWFHMYGNDVKKIGTDYPAYLGTIADIHDDYTENPDTFYGNYGRIVDQIKQYNPNALFIFSYRCTDSDSQVWQSYAAALKEIADHYGVPVVNWYDDNWWANWVPSHQVGNHPTYVEYAGWAKAADRLFAKLVEIDWEYFRVFYPAAD